ncbi:MAG: hypothetical protein AAF915_09635 [Cyanobacteria bacterium P01_D01_bin.50]
MKPVEESKTNPDSPQLRHDKYNSPEILELNLPVSQPVGGFTINSHECVSFKFQVSVCCT